MAGAGYKLFNTGDVLTAAQVNTYLNEQTVMVFASSAARTSALSGVLAEGMMSYLQDTNSVEVYNGSAWTAVGGGGLSSPLTTKGDVWGYSTTNARIPVGSNGTVLTADSAETLGVKWAAPAGGGKLLQVINAETATSASSTSNTYVDTNLTASITPSSTASKVLVTVHQSYKVNSNSVSMGIKLFRGATELKAHGTMIGSTAAGGESIFPHFSISYLDSPNTTSATTYKTQFSRQQGVATVTVNPDSIISYITLMEIGA